MCAMKALKCQFTRGFEPLVRKFYTPSSGRSSRRKEAPNSKIEEHEANEPLGDRGLKQRKRHGAAALSRGRGTGANARKPLHPRGRGVPQLDAALTSVRWQAQTKPGLLQQRKMEPPHV